LSATVADPDGLEEAIAVLKCPILCRVSQRGLFTQFPVH